MANKIQIKRTSTYNATDVSSLTLAYGELAWSNGNNKLYIGKLGSDNSTVSTTELNSLIVGGFTSASSSELNILDGATVTTAELNILDGVTSTAAELNILDGVTATTAELNIMDGVTASTSELNIMDGVTATTAELNIMDGITATTAELNHCDGVTSNIQTQLDSKGTGTGTVTSVATGNGLTGGTITSTGTLSLKNSFIDNTSSAVSTSTSASSFTNSSGYPVMLHAITNSTVGGIWTITIGGSGHSYNTQDGTGDTSDTVAVFLPNGASISISSGTFKYFAVQMRPG